MAATRTKKRGRADAEDVVFIRCCVPTSSWRVAAQVRAVAFYRLSGLYHNGAFHERMIRRDHPIEMPGRPTKRARGRATEFAGPRLKGAHHSEPERLAGWNNSARSLTWL
jgi:hypothetical protein